MTSRFIMPFADVGSGIKPSSGAKLFFFEINGTTPKDTFSDKAGTIDNTNPVIADSNGVFGNIYITGDYKVTLKDTNDSLKFSLAEVSEVSTGDFDTNLINDLSQAHEFATVAAYKIFATAFPVGKTIKLLDRGADFTVIAGTGTANTFNIIASTSVSQSIDLNNTVNPTVTNLGIGTDPTANAALLQYSADTYANIALDVEFEYDQTLVLKTVGTKIYSIGSDKIITWSGLDADWAIEAELNTGSYANDFKNFRLHASAVTKQLFNCQWVRFSFFENFVCFKGAIGMLHNSCWNNSFIKCQFRNDLNTPGSIGVDFRRDAGETFNVSNATTFIRCAFNKNEIGIRMEAGGDALSFDDSCGIEGNSWGVDFTGTGGSHSVTFEKCYIEKNILGNFRWNKAGGGNFFGVNIHNNYMGTESTARAGIIEFVVNNAARHSISIKGNTFRSFAGAPSEALLMDINGASMADTNIEWFNNKYTDSGINIQSFDAAAVDWRYMSTDIAFKPIFDNTFMTWTVTDEILIQVKDGIASMRGVIESTDNPFGVTQTINITQAMPVTLRPTAFVQKLSTLITDSNSVATQITMMVNGGVLRTLGIEQNKFVIDMSWNVGNQMFDTTTNI